MKEGRKAEEDFLYRLFRTLSVFFIDITCLLARSSFLTHPPLLARTNIFTRSLSNYFITLPHSSSLLLALALTFLLSQLNFSSSLSLTLVHSPFATHSFPFSSPPLFLPLTYSYFRSHPHISFSLSCKPTTP